MQNSRYFERWHSEMPASLKGRRHSGEVGKVQDVRQRNHEVDASRRPGLESSDLTPEKRRMFDIHLRSIICSPRQPDILVVVIDAALYHGVALADRCVSH